VQVPLNDALTSFRVVAVADSGAALFGTGQATLRTTQDLQLISGLPPLVREGDTFRAQFTLRNTTPKAMTVQVTPRATLLTLPAQEVVLPAGESREVAWSVTAPGQLAFTPAVRRCCGRSKPATAPAAHATPSRRASGSCPPCR
jgi:uncharacterized protein YfaS (alpha-2-macroglobulin family)